MGLKKEDITVLLDEAAKYVQKGLADGIRFSTRPDTVSAEMLGLLKDYPVSTIELGAQTMDDHVLSLANRGHTASDTVSAVAMLKERGYETGLHIMIGLPGDDSEKALSSARQIIALKPDFVRIHPTVVLKNAPLAERYQKGTYAPLPLDASVTLVKLLYLMFREHQIPAVRMGLQITADLEKGSAVLAGPHHPAFGHMVLSEVFLDMAVNELEKLTVSESRHLPEITIAVHPKRISAVRGLNNRNIEILKQRFQIQTLKTISNPDIGVDEVSVCLT